MEKNMFLGINHNVIIVLFTLLITTTYGFEPLHYYNYNIYQLFDIEARELLKECFVTSVYVDNMNPIYIMIHDVFMPLFQVPVLFFISSLFIKILIIKLLFDIVDFYVKSKNISLFISLLFVVSPLPDIHGMVHNGIFSSPVFFRASISTLFTLFAFKYLLNNRLVLAAIMFGISINMHLFYGITSFSAISLIFFFTASLHGYQIKIVEIVRYVIIVGLMISFYIFRALDANMPFSLPIEMKFFHDLAMATQEDDRLMIYSLKQMLYILVPSFIVGMYYIKKNSLPLLHSIFVKIFILLLLVVTIEIIHYNGVFFGKLSEIFLAMQFRRELWVSALFIYILFGIYLKKEIYSKNIHMKSSEVYVVLSITVMLILPSIYTLMLVLFSFIGILYNKNKKLALSVFSLIIVSILLYQLKELKSYEKISMLLAIATCFSMLIFKVFQDKLTIKKEYILIPLILYLFASAFLSVVTRKDLSNSINQIAANGFFKRGNLYYADTKKSELYVEVLEKLKEINNKKEILLHPFFIERKKYEAKIISESPVFFAGFDRRLGFMVKGYGEYFSYRLNEVFDQDMKSLYSPLVELDDKEAAEQIVLQHFTLVYNNISKEKLMYLKNKYKIKYYINQKQRDDLTLVFRNDEFYLYEL